MTAVLTIILVAGVVAVIIVTLHEMFEHTDPPRARTVKRPGSDEQWHERADAMRRYRTRTTHAKRGRRGRHRVC